MDKEENYQYSDHNGDLHELDYVGKCDECTRWIKKKTFDYSFRKFGKALCWGHQAKYKLELEEAEKQNPYEEPTYQDQ